MSGVDLQPDTADVLQEEGEPVSALPVCLAEQKAPVRVQVLPRKGGATFTKTVTTTPVRLLSADHRRASATLVSTGASDVFLFAFTQTAAQDPTTMSVWPAGRPLVVDAATEVWVALPSGGTPFQLGVSTSLWAEGE